MLRNKEETGAPRIPKRTICRLKTSQTPISFALIEPIQEQTITRILFLYPVPTQTVAAVPIRHSVVVPHERDHANPVLPRKARNP